MNYCLNLYSLFYIQQLRYRESLSHTRQVRQSCRPPLTVKATWMELRWGPEARNSKRCAQASSQATGKCARRLGNTNKWSAHRIVTVQGKFGIQNICSFPFPFTFRVSTYILSPIDYLSAMSNTLRIPVSKSLKIWSTQEMNKHKDPQSPLPLCLD